MIWATILAKDLKLIARDRPALLFNLVVPITVVAIVAGSLGGTEGGRLLVPIVNEDKGPVAEVLIEAIGKHADVVEMERSEAEAIVMAERHAPAALLIPRQTSKRYLGSRPSKLILLTDPSKRVELATMKAYLLLADRDAAALADPFWEELLVLEERPIVGRRLHVTAFEQSIPGFSVMFVLMGLLFGVAFGLNDERESGAFVRLRMAPVSRFEILAGKLTARFIVGAAQLAILLVFGHLVFGVSLGPSPIAFVLVTLSIAFAMTGFSLLTACLARTREQIIPLGLTVVMLVCALGGCWWPLFMEPPWLRTFAYATPTGWAMEGLNELILRERGLPAVASTIGILMAYGAACLAAGVRFYRLSD